MGLGICVLVYVPMCMHVSVYVLGVGVSVHT